MVKRPLKIEIPVKLGILLICDQVKIIINLWIKRKVKIDLCRESKLLKSLIQIKVKLYKYNLKIKTLKIKNTKLELKATTVIFCNQKKFLLKIKDLYLNHLILKEKVIQILNQEARSWIINFKFTKHSLRKIID